MRKKITYILKYFISCMIIFGLILPSYADSTAISDGGFFVTKAEYDSALADLNTRLTTFEATINSKIDGQVTSYLDRNGIWAGKKQDFATSWEMQDYEWSDDGKTVVDSPKRVLNIGEGCSWGDVFGCTRASKGWHLSWQDTKLHKQKEEQITTWTDWDNMKNNYYSTTTGYVSLVLGAGNEDDAGMKGLVQWSPTLGTKLIHTAPGTNGVERESVKWLIIPSINKSGLLFLDFGQIADYDPYLILSNQWQDVNWDTGMRLDFSIVFRRLDSDGNKIIDSWEEHWGDVSDSKIIATKAVMLDGVVKRVGNDNLPYSISSTKINISTFRKSVNFFVSTGEKIEAIVKTVGFNHANSYLGRNDWSYSPEVPDASGETGRGNSNMAIHGPVFKFYDAAVY